MRGIYIRIEKGEDYYDKDMMDTNYEEREMWYKTLSKGQITCLLEQFIKNNAMKQNS